MGHASRCVPIIEDLKKNNEVIIGVTKLNDFFFDSYFPELQKITIPSYNISYSKNLPLWLKLALQWPAINKVIRKEHLVLQQLIHEHKIDLVISDNRFGLYSENVRSIFMTHQLNLKVPFFKNMANKRNRKYIHRFNEVWVPDFEDKNRRLSGELSDSKGVNIPINYIGPQSALTLSENTAEQKRTDYLILLSGPEPQRTLLEKEILELIQKSSIEIILVRGTTNLPAINFPNIKIIPFAFGEELTQLIVNAKTVICRSGYSTLMDLQIVGKKKMILIPTKGQSEQEYLADYWKKKFGAEVHQQGSLRKTLKIH